MAWRTFSVFFAVSLFMLSSSHPAAAYLPYLAGNKTETVVDDPEISKTYYGWLSGKPADYLISSSKPFLLYLNLLAPQIDGARLDYSAIIYGNGEQLAAVKDEDALWEVTYEPFANDYYSKGPEYEARVPAGDYKIEVYNSGNSGNYVLAVGKTKDFSFGQFIRTLVVLPQVKEEFWGKAWWQAYNNPIGLLAFILLVGLLVITYFAISFIKRRWLKTKLDNEYKNYRGAR